MISLRGSSDDGSLSVSYEYTWIKGYVCLHEIGLRGCLHVHYTLVTVSGLRGQLQAILQCFPTNLRALNSMSASVKSVAQQLKSFDRIFVSQHENLLPTLPLCQMLDNFKGVVSQGLSGISLEVRAVEVLSVYQRPCHLSDSKQL